MAESAERTDWTLPHEFEACLSTSCVLHETEHCLCGKERDVEVHRTLFSELRRGHEAHLARLQEIISRDLYRVPPKELRALTWRERFAALNRFDWTEFRSGVGYRFVDDPRDREILGLAAWIS